MEKQKAELKKKVESILFAAGKKIEIVEIAKLCRMSHNLPLIEEILNELKEKYNSEESPLFLNTEATAWKLTVREKYVSVVQNIVKQSELSKTIMETLAVIAYKAPVLQSDIIKIRTNKAYDHLRELENSGYISREKKGRTKLIKITPKFFEYFDIPPEKLKERFKNVHELEKVVEQKEEEAKEAKKEIHEKKTENKKLEVEFKELSEKEVKELDVKIKEKEDKVPEVDLVDKNDKETELDTYDSEVIEGTDFEEPKSNIVMIREKVNDLDVVELGLPKIEKEKLIKEAAELRRQAEAKEKGKASEDEVEAEKEEKEKEFGEKFNLVDSEKEKEIETEESETGKKESDEEKLKEENKETKEPEEKETETEKGESSEDEVEAEKEEKIEEEPEEERLSQKSIVKEAAEERKKHPPKKKEGKMLFEKGMSKEVEDKVDKRVEEIVFGKKEDKDLKLKKEENPTEELSKDEPKIE